MLEYPQMIALIRTFFVAEYKSIKYGELPAVFHRMVS